MSAFAPCPACRRHVRVDERTCPFCAAPVEGARPIDAPTGRLSRAHLLLAAAALASCTKTDDAPVRADPQGRPSIVASSSTAPIASASSVPIDELVDLGVASIGGSGSPLVGGGVGAAYGAPPSPLAKEPASPSVKTSDFVGCTRADARILSTSAMRVRACYRKVLESDPKSAGTLRLAAALTPGGKVDEVRTVSSSVSKAAAACAIDVVEGLSFPESVAGCEIAYTLTFSPH